MKKNKIFIKMGGLLIGVLSIYLLFSQNIYATGTCPVPLADIESVGVLKYETDSPIELYTSDLKNLKDEINSLGIYTDEQLTQINTDIDNLITDVENGKKTVATKINSKTGATTVTTTNPTWAQLSSGVDSVYTKGYNTGYSTGYTKGKSESSDVKHTFGVSSASGDWQSVYIFIDGVRITSTPVDGTDHWKSTPYYTITK